MTKTYTFAGVSTTASGVTKVRVGNDESRKVRIVANGDSNVDFFKLPNAMTETEVAEYLLSTLETTEYQADKVAVTGAINAVLTVKTKTEKVAKPKVAKAPKVAKVAKVADTTVKTATVAPVVSKASSKSTHDLINISGQLLGVGDSVCFKDDYEKHGTIVRINNRTLTIEYVNEYDDTITVLEDADECWCE
jgi:hypothetical protein